MATMTVLSLLHLGSSVEFFSQIPGQNSTRHTSAVLHLCHAIIFLISPCFPSDPSVTAIAVTSLGCHCSTQALTHLIHV
jgi:uncharacterized membrane protein